MTIISVHVPKSGGTSLADVFDHGTERKVLFDYRADYSNIRFTDEEKAEFRAALPFIRRHVRIIHGHFYLQKYTELMPDAKTMTCFRYPVDRIVSQYRHIYYDTNADIPMRRKILDGLGIVDFAALPNIARAYLVHLGAIPPGELDFIFLSDRLDEGIRLFHAYFPGVINPRIRQIPKRNVGARRESISDAPRLVISRAEYEKIEQLAADEIEYYREAVARYEALRDRAPGERALVTS